MVEAIGGVLIASRLQRKTLADPRTVRNLQKRIQHSFVTLREHMAVHLEPPSEEQIQACSHGTYPWRPQGRAATALPHLAARYRDARAEVRSCSHS